MKLDSDAGKRPEDYCPKRGATCLDRPFRANEKAAASGLNTGSRTECNALEGCAVRLLCPNRRIEVRRQRRRDVARQLSDEAKFNDR